MRRAPHAGVRHVAVAADLVRGVDDDDPLADVVGEDARRLAQLRGLADAGAAEEQDVASALEEVADGVDGAGDGAADPQGEPDDVALAVADRRDAVEGPLDAGAVVGPEGAQAREHPVELGAADGVAAELERVADQPDLGQAPEIEDELDQRVTPGGRDLAGALLERRGQKRDQPVELLCEVVQGRP
jgi:hypothetical protein